ncbi:UNVERIFIED_CONTAM: hypothetical protein NCL1_20656 [Trichonephila clavipes]
MTVGRSGINSKLQSKRINTCLFYISYPSKKRKKNYKENKKKDAEEFTVFSILKKTRGHRTTPLRVKEDIEDVCNELGNGDEGLHFLDETSKALLLSVS